MKGWFATDERPGDRTLSDQLTGLGRLMLDVQGKSVLDVGCAEGLISIACARAYAKEVHGVEIVASHLEIGRTLAYELPVTFEHADANNYLPLRQYDFVLLLAVLHKLKNPTNAAARFAACADQMVVIRLPPENAPCIIDSRSDFRPHNIGELMQRCGFDLIDVTRGHFNEWCGWYQRV